MNKLTKMIVAASAMLPLATMATTVAYWPLTQENGVRTTLSTGFANEGDGGTMDAVPVVVRNYYGSQEGDAKFLPVGTNAFPTAYGVYDPVAKANKAAATGLNFDSWSMNDNWWNAQYIASYSGCLKVSDADALKLSTFTVECFVMPATGRSGYTQCLAVMPMSVVVEGTKEVVGKESWGIRFSNQNRPYLAYSYVAGGTTNYVNTAPGSGTKVPFDNRWHHLAFSVDRTTLKIYIDYVLEYTQTLSGEVVYDQDAELFIGGGTFPKQSYYGSMAHFRVSNEALTSDKFLHFTRTTRAEDVADDVVLHLDFEPVDGISTNNAVVFNRAATGSAVHLHTADNSTYAGYAKFDTGVYTNKIYSSRKDSKGKDSTRIFSKTSSNQENPYLSWYPDEDIFHNYSFTVEMFEKASSVSDWGTFLKRRRSSSASSQFALCINNKSKKLMAVIAGNSSITDTVTINDNTWHHVAVVCDKTNGTSTFFRDWRQTGSASLSADITAIEGYPPIVFCGDPGDHSYFIGKLGDVRITKRALAAKEFLTPERAQGLIIVFY